MEEQGEVSDGVYELPAVRWIRSDGKHSLNTWSYVFLRKDTLFSVVDSLMLRSRPTALGLLSARSLSDVFSLSGASLSACASEHGTALCLGPFLNCGIYKKHKKCGRCGSKMTVKRALVSIWEQKQDRVWIA